MKKDKPVKSNFVYTMFITNESKSLVVLNKLKSNENIGCSVRILKSDTALDLLNKIEYIYLFNCVKLDSENLKTVHIDIPENEDGFKNEDIVAYGIYTMDNESINDLVDKLSKYKGTDFIKTIYTDELKSNGNIAIDNNYKYMIELVDIFKNRVDTDIENILYDSNDHENFDLEDMDLDGFEDLE